MVPEPLIQSVLKQMQTQMKTKYIYKIPKPIKEKQMYTKYDTTTGMEINTNEITKKKLLSTGNNIPRLKYIYDFKNAFKNCAHSYMDKNAGAGILLCHNYYEY